MCAQGGKKTVCSVWYKLTCSKLFKKINRQLIDVLPYFSLPYFCALKQRAMEFGIKIFSSTQRVCLWSTLQLSKMWTIAKEDMLRSYYKMWDSRRQLKQQNHNYSSGEISQWSRRSSEGSGPWFIPKEFEPRVWKRRNELKKLWLKRRDARLEKE